MLLNRHSTAASSSTVEVAEPISLTQLYRLMEEYTKRLNSSMELLYRQNSFASIKSVADSSVALKDIEYLATRTARLVAKASAYRESYNLDESDQLEIELYLFDAEAALRPARPLLSNNGLSRIP